MYMYVCIYESICNAPLLQPKQSRVRARRPNRKDVFSRLQKCVSVNVGSRIDGGREFHSFGAQAAKLRGPKLVARQASIGPSSQYITVRCNNVVMVLFIALLFGSSYANISVYSVMSGRH